MTKRLGISKGLRFDVFRRDLFTCQYCGAQPPDVVLEIDHILPVYEGGDNDESNLITSCEACNRGKSSKVLSQPIIPVDPDLSRLEVSQKLAELKRFQQEKQALQAETERVAAVLQGIWRTIMQEDEAPDLAVLQEWLRRLDPEEIEEAFYSAAKLRGRSIYMRWRYCCGAMWKMVRGE